MIAEEETSRTYYDKIGDVYYMHYKDMAINSVKVLHNEANIVNNKFGSDDVLVTKDVLKQILNKYNYFKQ